MTLPGSRVQAAQGTSSITPPPPPFTLPPECFVVSFSFFQDAKLSIPIRSSRGDFLFGFTFFPSLEFFLPTVPHTPVPRCSKQTSCRLGLKLYPQIIVETIRNIPSPPLITFPDGSRCPLQFSRLRLRAFLTFRILSRYGPSQFLAPLFPPFFCSSVPGLYLPHSACLCC